MNHGDIILLSTIVAISDRVPIGIVGSIVAGRKIVVNLSTVTIRVVGMIVIIQSI